jgi:hypothetical protein
MLIEPLGADEDQRLGSSISSARSTVPVAIA